MRYQANGRLYRSDSTRQ